MTSNKIKAVLLLAVLMLTELAFHATAEEQPKPDCRPTSAEKPLKVYILAGQSNMLEQG